MIAWLAQPWVRTLAVWVLVLILALSLAWDIFAQLVLKARPRWALLPRQHARSQEAIDWSKIVTNTARMSFPTKPGTTTPDSPFREPTRKPWSER